MKTPLSDTTAPAQLDSTLEPTDLPATMSTNVLEAHAPTDVSTLSEDSSVNAHQLITSPTLVLPALPVPQVETVPPDSPHEEPAV